jgi:hypothetical protein
MTIQTISTIPLLIFDDGAVLLFQFTDTNNNLIVTGFLHRPLSAAETETGNPPITFSETSDLGSWLETVKNAVRNQRLVRLIYDDANANSYTPQWPGAQTYTVSPLWGVTDVPSAS